MGVMKRQHWIILGTVTFIFAAGVMAALLNQQNKGILVVVKNATGGSISNLQVKFTGGNHVSPMLKPAEIFQTRANPNGESHLGIEYNDAVGKKISANVGGYFENGYSGTFHVELQPDGTFVAKDEITIGGVL